MASVTTAEAPAMPPASLMLKRKLDASATATTAPSPTPASAGPSRRKKHIKGKPKHRAQQPPEPCSPEDVLWRDIVAMLGRAVVDQHVEAGTEFDSPFEFKQEVEVIVDRLSSTGEGIALSPDVERPWAVVVPLALPGEKIRVRVYRSGRMHSLADLLEVITPNTELRDPSRIRCKYFGTCAGCQYQMLSYEKQLELKRDVIVKAYQNFSNLDPNALPTILPTSGSPLQYGYRTKISPHFDAPPRHLQKNPPSAEFTPTTKPDWLSIGFHRIGMSKTMDIEECPIASPVINQALPAVRENVIKNIMKYKKGVTLLFRDSLPLHDADADGAGSKPHVCVADPNASVREQVGDFTFQYVAGSFFQNNNSVLVPLTSYVRDAIFSPSTLSSDTSPSPLTPTHLVDAYCGAGLFSITLSPHFTTSAGIELSTESIKAANHNAHVLNHIPESKLQFYSGDASDIFKRVEAFPREQTVVIIDPPRKGCSEEFVKQLVQFGAGTVVYVSCNVHTQARDVGMILELGGARPELGLERQEGKEQKKGYVLESVRGFDLFPQTAHVESVAVLRMR